RCRLNGTYDVDYDDGEKETGIDGDLIRPKVDSSADVGNELKDKSETRKATDEKPSGDGSKAFSQGDKVEAKYKGRSRYYPGVINRCRLNGTYDVDYDDGEKET
ncbi:hypothetical protein ABG067_009445, partial [Albugo candida]